MPFSPRFPPLTLGLSLISTKYANEWMHENPWSREPRVAQTNLNASSLFHFTFLQDVILTIKATSKMVENSQYLTRVEKMGKQLLKCKAFVKWQQNSDKCGWCVQEELREKRINRLLVLWLLPITLWATWSQLSQLSYIYFYFSLVWFVSSKTV